MVYWVVLGVFCQMLLSSFVMGEVNLYHSYDTDCEVYVNDLSGAVTELTDCYIKHATPVSFCGWCRDKLDNLTMLINNRTATTLFGVPCIDVLQQSDYAFDKLFNVIPSVWNDTYCSQCLRDTTLSVLDNPDKVIPLANQSPVLFHTLRVLGLPQQFYNLPEYTEAAQEFFTTLFEAVDCFSHHLINSSISLLDILSLTDEDLVVFNKSVCTDCSLVYHRLLYIYESRLMQIKDERTPSTHSQTESRFIVCHDVQYALNRTQWAWFYLMGCRSTSEHVTGSLLPVLLCIAMIVLFHSLIYTVFHNPTRILIYQPMRVEARQPLLEHQFYPESETAQPSFPSYGSTLATESNRISTGFQASTGRRVPSTTSMEYSNRIEPSFRTSI